MGRCSFAAQCINEKLVSKKEGVSGSQYACAADQSKRLIVLVLSSLSIKNVGADATFLFSGIRYNVNVLRPSCIRNPWTETISWTRDKPAAYSENGSPYFLEVGGRRRRLFKQHLFWAKEFCGCNTLQLLKLKQLRFNCSSWSDSDSVYTNEPVFAAWG